MRQTTITEEQEQKLAAALGVRDVNVSDYVLYKATALTNNPLRRPGQRQDKGVFSVGALEQLTNLLNEETVPLRIEHRTDGLPVGRVFDAELLQTESGKHQVDVWFFVDADDIALTAKLDKGIVDQLSVGVAVENQMCSACGYDYTKDDESLSRLYFKGECPDGHVLGEGAHIVIGQITTCTEISLVGKGASPGARVQPNEQISLSVEGNATETTHHITCLTEGLTTMSDENKNDGEDLSVKLAEVTAQLAEKDAEIETLKADKTIALSEKTTAEAKIKTAEQKHRSAEHQVQALTAEKTALEESLSEVKDVLVTTLKTNQIVLTGQEPDKVPEDVADLAAQIKLSQEKLEKAFPIGGITDNTSGTTDQKSHVSLSGALPADHFITRK